MFWMCLILLMTFASFWCTCALNGTVRAATWVFPILVGLSFACQSGGWVAPGLMNFVLSRLDFFTGFGFTNAVSNIQQFGSGTNFMVVTTLFLVPTLLVAVIQSCRLFREQAQDSILSLIRNLFPIAAMVFLCSFSFMAFFAFVDHAKLQMWTMFSETHQAIEKIQPGTPNLDAAHPLQVTGEDLAKASSLSERTRYWLRNARISVAPNKAYPRGFCCPGNSRGFTYPPEKDYSWYSATIHLASGSDCTLSFGGRKGYGVLGGLCK